VSDWRRTWGGLYEVSDEGQVRNAKNLRLRRGVSSNGYLKLALPLGHHKFAMLYIHRLVAIAFLGLPPSPKHEVNHKNGVKGDNRASNLEWVTRSENNKHSFKYLNRPRPRGEKSGKALLTELAVRKIRAFCALGFMQKDVAAAFGVDKSTVGHIVRGSRWAHIA
jgi:hypothetical protein